MNHTKGTAMESKESAQLAQRIQDHFHATLGPLYLPERIDRERVYETTTTGGDKPWTHTNAS